MERGGEKEVSLPAQPCARCLILFWLLFAMCLKAVFSSALALQAPGDVSIAQRPLGTMAARYCMPGTGHGAPHHLVPSPYPAFQKLGPTHRPSHHHQRVKGPGWGEVKACGRPWEAPRGHGGVDL